MLNFNFLRALCAVFFFGWLFVMPASAAQGRDGKSGKLGGFNFLPALFVVCIFAVLTACGGGGGGGNNSAAAPTPSQMLALDAPEMGALVIEGQGDRTWFIVLSLAAEVQTTVLFGESFTVQRQTLTAYSRDGATISIPAMLPGGIQPPPVTQRAITLPRINRERFHANGDLAPLINNGAIVYIEDGGTEIAFQTRPTVILAHHLCSVPWLAPGFREGICPNINRLSYSPDMQRVVYAAMADGFNRGVDIGDSGFAFSGRYDGDNRAAGFVYDFADYGFAMRTDYVRLPSKQDGAVWLDTYRFGIMPIINDDMRLFAGVDTYNNAIFAIDTKGDGLQHRLGAAIGEGNNGYAIKYELRLNL